MAPSEEVLRGLLAAAPDALVAVDASGTILFVNDQVERLFGWTSEELVGRDVEFLVPDRYAHRHPVLRAAYFTKPISRPMGGSVELWAQRRDGSEFPAEVSLSSFDTSAGLLIAAAIRDATERRRVEQRFRAVLKSVPDAIVGVDATGRIELVNTQAESLFGWSAEELLDQQIEMLIPSEVVTAHIAHHASYVDDPSPRSMGENRQFLAYRKDGTTFPAEISLSAVTEDSGSTLVLAAVRDVTDRLEFEADRQQQALAAQREQSHRLESLGQLAGGIAHDFNNLLGVILIYARLLSREVSEPSQAADLEEIRVAAARAAELTKQLLTFARRDVAMREPTDVCEAVRGMESMLERTLGEGIQVQMDVPDAEPLVVLAGRQQLEQIVLNLAINARDAMTTGGVLTLRVQRGGPGEVIFELSDTGTGMSDEVLSHVYEPFFTTKPRGAGTGLGLATVYGIVRRNDGDIRIQSAEGAGTTVQVTLREVDEPARQHDGPSALVATGTERILLVEDEPALRRATARILADHGYEVSASGDGVEALELIKTSPAGFDLVLSDYAMPRMGGAELANQLKERGDTTPILFMSGYDWGTAPLVGRLLAKPVEQGDLLRSVREALDG